MVRIELFFSKHCHVWKQTLEEVCNALSELGIREWVCVYMIADDMEAEEKKFPGSPTVKVDGRDIDPMFGKMRVFKANACRQYVYRGKCYERPPKEMIVEALSKA